MAVANLDAELHKLKIDRRRKRGRGGGLARSVAGLGAVALAAFGGYTYYAKANAEIPVKTMRVVARVAAPGETTPAGSAVLTAGGYVVPRDRIEVSSKIVGQVKEISVERGDFLNAGDTILLIDDEEYVAQVRMAEARVASLKAQFDELRAGSRDEEIGVARAAVASAEANLTKAEADLARFAELAAADIVAAEELESARRNRDVAAAELESTRRNLELVLEGPRKERIRAVEAQIAEAEANLEFARVQLGYTVLRAPISGTILEKVAKKGELVTNTNFGGTRGAKSSVVSMADLADLQVELDVNEDDLPRVKMDQKCEIRLDSHPDIAFAGVVDEISPQADRQKGTVQVKVKMLDAAKDFVRPEVNARVSFLADEPPPAPVSEPEAEPAPRVFVPRTALVGGSAVFVVGDGRALRREVTTAGETADGVEIASGLGGGELLIVDPPPGLTDGARVRTDAPAAN